MVIFTQQIILFTHIFLCFILLGAHLMGNEAKTIFHTKQIVKMVKYKQLPLLLRYI